MPPLASHDENNTACSAVSHKDGRGLVSSRRISRFMNAIVLDGEQRAALAVTRSLGGRGVKVFVGSEKKSSLSSCSRYCAKSFIYPSPYIDPVGFLESLIGFAKSQGHSVLFPITDVTLSEILLNKQKLPGNLLVPFDRYDKYIQLTDKMNLIRMARELDVRVPPTILSTDYEDPEIRLRRILKLGFPVVIKSSLSRIRTDSGWFNTRVIYANSEENLRKILTEDLYLHYPFIVQKRIYGPGVGIFLLMKEGQVVAKFAHRRIREKPPSGGVSVVSESIIPPEDVLRSAIKILANVDWTGVAMVEFKVDLEEKIAKLLEVNARFWGSLQLSISSGVDFPYMLYRLAQGEQIFDFGEYMVGLRSRWELGDFDHLLIRLLKNPITSNVPVGLPSRTVLLKEFFFDFFRSSVKNEVFQLNDVKPFLHELKRYIQQCFH